MRWLEKKYLAGERYVAVAEIPKECPIEDEHLNRLIERFKSYGLLKPGGTMRDRTIEILRPIVDAVHQADNQPPPDYWDKTTKWFRSKRWSLPVFVIVVGLPALWGYVDLVKKLVVWITEGK